MTMRPGLPIVVAVFGILVLAACFPLADLRTSLEKQKRFSPSEPDAQELRRVAGTISAIAHREGEVMRTYGAAAGQQRGPRFDTTLQADYAMLPAIPMKVGPPPTLGLEGCTALAGTHPHPMAGDGDFKKSFPHRISSFGLYLYSRRPLPEPEMEVVKGVRPGGQPMDGLGKGLGLLAGFVLPGLAVAKVVARRTGEELPSWGAIWALGFLAVGLLQWCLGSLVSMPSVVLLIAVGVVSLVVLVFHGRMEKGDPVEQPDSGGEGDGGSSVLPPTGRRRGRSVPGMGMNSSYEKR